MSTWAGVIMAGGLDGQFRPVDSPPPTAGLYSSRGTSPTAEEVQVTSDPYAENSHVSPLQAVIPLSRSPDSSEDDTSPTVVVHEKVKHFPHFIYADAPMSASTDDDPTTHTQSYCSRGPYGHQRRDVRHVNPCPNTETVLSLSEDTIEVDEISEARWADESATMAAPPPPPLQYASPSCGPVGSCSTRISPLVIGNSPSAVGDSFGGRAPPPSPETVVSVANTEPRGRSPDDDGAHDSRRHLPPQPPPREEGIMRRRQREPMSSVSCFARALACLQQLRDKLRDCCCCLNSDEEEPRSPPPVNPFSQMPRRTEQVPHQSLDGLEVKETDKNELELDKQELEGIKEERPTAQDLASFRQMERDLTRSRRSGPCCPQ
eukprot:Hpha_TRINITY_DN11467_c0_g1::TRINITY_DN11467_c0_g1_i1::g.137314::m.137314